jgi:hypothetical protein
VISGSGFGSVSFCASCRDLLLSYCWGGGQGKVEGFEFAFAEHGVNIWFPRPVPLSWHVERPRIFTSYCYNASSYVSGTPVDFCAIIRRRNALCYLLPAMPCAAENCDDGYKKPKEEDSGDAALATQDTRSVGCQRRWQRLAGMWSIFEFEGAYEVTSVSERYRPERLA